ncbi:hypothetical protein LLH03_19915 [bacterium]|nr:hypothetical protein [bacterium]
MSRLLCVVAAMLLVTAAMAQTIPFAETNATDPALPIAASADFHATVLTYASVHVIPPTTLTIPGDVDGEAGFAAIEPVATVNPETGQFDDPEDPWKPAAGSHGGLVEASANSSCLLDIAVTEFAGNGSTISTNQKLKSLVKVGAIAGSTAPATSLSALWIPLDTESATPQYAPGLVGTEFVQVIDGVGGWDPTANSGSGASITDMPSDTITGATYVVKGLRIDPLNDNPSWNFRYLRVFWGTKAYNRINPDIADETHNYDELAAQGDYVATVTATLTANEPG